MNDAEYHHLAQLEDQLWYFSSLHQHMERELLRAMRNGRAGKVLDAGCGTGGFIARMQRKHPQWTLDGLDFSPLACKFSKERTGATITEGSITSLPYADEQFDAVVSADVLCQVDNPFDAAREFFRVIKPGAVVVINVPAYMWMWSYHDDQVHTKHRYTSNEVRSLLSTAGFRGIQTTHWNALPFPVIWAKRKLLSRRDETTSDVKPYSIFVQAPFRLAMVAEHAWIQSGGRWGWGTSIFAVARKPLVSDVAD